MTIIAPTIDDFKDTTVMRVIRKIVDYIMTDLITGINANDVKSIVLECTPQGMLSGKIIKNDNSEIAISGVQLPTTGEYQLPIASISQLGGIKVGDNLSIEEDGTLNAVGGTGGTDIVSTETPGMLEIDSSSKKASIVGAMISSSSNAPSMSINGSGNLVISIPYVQGTNGDNPTVSNVTFTLTGVNFNNLATKDDTADLQEQISTIGITGSYADNNLHLEVNGASVDIPFEVSSYDDYVIINRQDVGVGSDKGDKIDFLSARTTTVNGFKNAITLSRGITKFVEFGPNRGISTQSYIVEANKEYYSSKISIAACGNNVYTGDIVSCLNSRVSHYIKITNVYVYPSDFTQPTDIILHVVIDSTEATINTILKDSMKCEVDTYYYLTDASIITVSTSKPSFN